LVGRGKGELKGEADLYLFLLHMNKEIVA
jgi:hypothetical protein